MGQVETPTTVVKPISVEKLLMPNIVVTVYTDYRLEMSYVYFPKNRPLKKKNLSFQSFSSGNYFVFIIAQPHRGDNIIAGNITNMPRRWRWCLG